MRVKAVYDNEDGDIPQLALGTGFFISRQGYVLTTTSIIYGPKRVWIEYKGISYAVRFIGVDTATNVALLQVINLPESFDFIHLTDSGELPEVGTIALRISCPLDFAPSPTMGLVSGIESRVAGHFFPCSYIRTTVPVGMGDGGAAFIDLNGRFVGMQVLSLNDIGSSYIIPSRALLRVYYDLVSENQVSYAWGGFVVDPVTSLDQGRQFRVKEVSPDSPASAVGIQVGDIIVQVGDYVVNDIDDMRNAFFYTRVGEYIRIKARRGDDMLDFNLRLAERPESDPPQFISFDLQQTTIEAKPDADKPAEQPPAADQGKGMDSEIPAADLQPKSSDPAAGVDPVE